MSNKALSVGCMALLALGPLASRSASQADPAFSASPGLEATTSYAGACERTEFLQPGNGRPINRAGGFLENRGQADPRALFVAQSRVGTAFVTEDGLALKLRGGDGAAAVFLRVEGASPEVAVAGEAQRPGFYNFLIGADRSAWAHHVPCFERVRMSAIRPGLDLVWYEGEEGLEYDLELEDARALAGFAVEFAGVESMCLEADGTLHLQTPAGELQQRTPRAWRVAADGARIPVAVRQRILPGQRVGFEFGGEVPEDQVVIDPVLAYATLIDNANGWGGDVISDLALLPCGDVLSTGTTDAFWTGFPVTPGAYDTSLGNNKTFIVRTTADASTVVFGTYFGGSLTDVAHRIAALSDGSPVIAGLTHSSDFPLTAGAFDATIVEDEPWLARLTSDGSDLVFSTFLGGAADDDATGLAVDSQDEIYVSGWSYSGDFPTTPGVLREVNGFPGNGDAFLARFGSDGTIHWCTLFGADAGVEIAKDLVLTPEGIPCLVGDGIGQPVTSGAFDTTSCQKDGFVSKVSADGTTLLFSTVFGGCGSEWTERAAADGLGRIYVVGQTGSTGFPITPNAPQKSKLGSVDNGFLIVLDGSLSTNIFGTYLADLAGVLSKAVAGSDSGVASVTGTGSLGIAFPITPDALKPTIAGAGVYLWQADILTGELVYSSYFEAEQGYAVRRDAFDDIILGGRTSPATPFPVTPGVLNPGPAVGWSAGYLAKFDFGPWSNSGFSLAPVGSVPPVLHAVGDLLPGTPGDISLSGAPAFAPLSLVVGLAPLKHPFKGGLLVPSPDLIIPLLANDAGGVSLAWDSWPTGLASGTTFELQAWVVDATGPKGLTATNAVHGSTP